MGKWVQAQDLFDAYSSAEEELAFDRAGGHAYDFELSPPVRRGEPEPTDEPLIDLDNDELLLDDLAVDDYTTAALRVMSAELTDTIAVMDDEATGTLPSLA